MSLSDPDLIEVYVPNEEQKPFLNENIEKSRASSLLTNRQSSQKSKVSSGSKNAAIDDLGLKYKFKVIFIFYFLNIKYLKLSIKIILFL